MTIYDWIDQRCGSIDALRLSRASGVAIENLAAEDVEKLAAPFKHRAQNAGGSKTSPDGLLPGVERARGR